MDEKFKQLKHYENLGLVVDLDNVTCVLLSPLKAEYDRLPQQIKEKCI